MRLFLIGYYGHGLSGDEGVLRAMVRDLRALVPRAAIVVTSADPDLTHAEHGVEAVRLDEPAALLAEIQAADAVLIGGGGVFTEYADHAPLRPGLAPLSFTELCCDAPALAALFGKRSFIFAAGVEPLRSPEAAAAVRAAFAAATGATVRDSGSRRELARIGVDVTRVAVTCDPAATLARAPPLDRAALGLAGERPVLALALRHWDLEPGRLSPEPQPWEAIAAEAVGRFARATGARLLLISSHDDPSGWAFSNDSAFLHRFAARLPGIEAVAAPGPPSPERVIAALGAADLALVARHHAAIFAMIAMTPVVTLAYSVKAASVMEDVGLGDYAPPLASLTVEGLEAQLHAAWRERAALKPRLAAIDRARRLDHGRTLRGLAEVLRAPPPDPAVHGNAAARWLASGVAARATSQPAWDVILAQAANHGPDRAAQLRAVEVLCDAHPASAPLRFYRAILTEVVRPDDDTDPLWREAVAAGFSPDWAWYHWGGRAERLGRPAEARARYGAALALNPGHAQARAALTELDTAAG